MISLIHDDSVNLADLQNKIIEIQDYLNTRKNDIIDNVVSLNIENYTIDDNQYYKKTKRYDYSIDTLDTQKIIGSINIDEDHIELGGRKLSGKLYNEIKLLSKNDNKISNLFIVKKSGTYKDVDQTIIVSILENNLIIDNVEKVSNIFIR